jgi:hypothetical protein
LDCSLSQLYFDPEKVIEESDGILTRCVQDFLIGRHGEKILPLVKVGETYEKMTKSDTEDTLRSLAMRLGQALRADAVIAGTVWRYKKKATGHAGVETPASVAFAVFLIDPANGRAIWRGLFDEKQTSPPSEDFLDARTLVKRGAKWLSADELARRGVKEVFKKSPL